MGRTGRPVSTMPKLQRRLVDALMQAGVLASREEPASLIETHISWVILAGEYAWKIKKAVNLGFLDFTTLARRRHFCQEELRLNRRLAPDLYLDVVAIRGAPEVLRLNSLQDGPGEDALEYAVKMRRFPQSGLADRMLAAGTLEACHLDELAHQIASFHKGLPGVDAAAPWGAPEVFLSNALGNFAHTRNLSEGAMEQAILDQLEAWCRRGYGELAQFMAERRRTGFVRECHGDLHLGNIAVVEGRVRVFDGIEFNPGLRWIDIQSEVAFLLMDLARRGRPDYGARFLNAWLEQTGDYSGLRLLAWHLVYRAIVRAKVALIRSVQPGLAKNGADAAREEHGEYLRLAATLARPRRRALIITHGLSGSGKTRLSQTLLESLGAVRLRSDVERKRLAGLAPDGQSGSDPGRGLYGEAMGQATYAELSRLAREVLNAGFTVIVDATFLRRELRQPFRDMARELNVPFLMLACEAPVDVLRQRIKDRLAGGQDASEATLTVLDLQLEQLEALSDEEWGTAIRFDTSADSPDRLVAKVRRRLERTDPGATD